MQSSSIIDEFLADLSERERRILADRLAARKPRTLDELGRDFGVSRERVRQIEAQLRTKLTNFSWFRVMSGVVPMSGSWLRAVDQILLTPEGSTWATPTTAGPTILDMLLAAGEIDLLDDEWVGRQMQETDSGTSPLVELINLASAGTCSEQRFIGELQDLGLPRHWAHEWIIDHGYVVRQGMICTQYETLADFLEREFRAADRPVDLDTIERWIHGRWTFGSAKNLLHNDPRFVRVDVQSYALADAGLPPYRGIREEIAELITECGPLPLAEVVQVLTSNFAVEAKSVQHYAKSRPFVISDGLVDVEGSGATSTPKLDGLLKLADMPEGRQWRHVFYTPTGYAYRFTVNSDHLRGSGWGVGGAVARIVGLQEGQVWQHSLDNVDATIKVTRKLQQQPALGSLKVALDTLGASIGDSAFLRFDGTEGNITRVALTVHHPEGHDNPLDQALQLVGCDTEESQPLQYIQQALGVLSDSPASLAAIASGRWDQSLAAALTLVDDVHASPTEPPAHQFHRQDSSLSATPVARVVDEREDTGRSHMRITIGAATLEIGNSSVAVEGDTFSGGHQHGQCIPAEVRTPDGGVLEIGLTSWENGDRDIRCFSRLAGPLGYDRLVHGARLGVAEKRPNEWDCELGVLKYHADRPPTVVKAAMGDLDRVLGARAEELLTSLGATAVGTKEAVLGDAGRRRGYVVMTAPEGDPAPPLAAYVLTRVLPLMTGFGSTAPTPVGLS